MRQIIILGITLSLCGCSSKSGSGAKISTRFKVTNAASTSFEALFAPLPSPHLLSWLPGERASQNGAANGTNLKSLKYFITSITICQSATFSGSAFNNPKGCVTLYQGPVNADLQAVTSSNVSTAPGIVRSKNITTGFIDLVDPASRAALNQDVAITSDQAGDYTVGFVNWYYPIEVTATITKPGSNPVQNLLCTHDGTTQNATTNGQSFTPTVSSTSLGVCPAEQAIIALGNGGNFFHFEKPFTISAADITAGTTYALDLTFNPDGLVQGVTAPGATNFPPLVDNANGPPSGSYNSIFVPILQLTPVPHKTTETVMRETYTGTLNLGTGNLATSRDIRLELYYLNDDTQKTIYGFNDTYIPNAGTTDYIAGSPYVNSISTNTDGTLAFNDYAGTSQFNKFQRGTKVGDTTTMQVPCSGTGGGIGPGSSDPNCTGGSGAFEPVTMTLTKIDTI